MTSYSIELAFGVGKVNVRPSDHCPQKHTSVLVNNTAYLLPFLSPISHCCFSLNTVLKLSLIGRINRYRLFISFLINKKGEFSNVSCCVTFTLKIGKKTRNHSPIT